MSDHSKCWACSIKDISGRNRNKRDFAARIERYEQVVEYIESLPSGTVIRRPDVWRAVGAGQFMYPVVGLVITDMYLHGLLVCVKRDLRGCFAYRVQ